MKLVFLLYFASLLVCFLLFALLFGFVDQPLSLMTPLKLPPSLEDFIFVDISTINVK